MDNITIQSVWTVLVFITFMGIVFWAYSSARKKDFDTAANSIFDDQPCDEASHDAASKDAASKDKHKNTKETL